MANGNREFKSDVFSMLMENPKNALEVYNALNNSSIEDPNLVDICTLEKGISLTVRNDAAFIVDASLSVYEHQSTVCPNMPMRSLIYFTYMMEKLVKDQNIYGSKLVRIPEPQFVVFYNGDRDQPELQELKLSDAFQKKTVEPQVELICKVYNINAGKNETLLGKCKVLKDYMTFVDNVKSFYTEQDYEDLARAINRAIDKCIKENVLAEFLQENRDEVVQVTTLDYTFDRQIMLEREEAATEARAEGREEGREEGRAEGREEEQKKLLTNMINNGATVEVVAELTGFSVAEVKCIVYGE